MHANSDKLKKLYILDNEVKSTISTSIPEVDLDDSVKGGLVKSFQLATDFYNYTNVPVRIIGQDNLEILLEPSSRPPGVDPGIIITKNYTTYSGKSKLDPRCKTNAPTNEFEQSVAKEIQNANKKTLSRYNNPNKSTTDIKVLHLIPIAEFDTSDTIYDSRSNYVITSDLSRNLLHPNTAQARQINDVIDLHLKSKDNEGLNKYVLVDNSNLYPELYINTGCNVLCVKSIKDSTRETGLYVYSLGVVDKTTHGKEEMSVVKFDIETILSEKLFAYVSLLEAKAAGNMDERYKELEKRTQQKTIQDEKVFKNTESNSKREERMREEKHKKIMDGIKLSTAVVGFATVLITTIVKTKK